jgi:hypothetical protein
MKFLKVLLAAVFLLSAHPEVDHQPQGLMLSGVATA